MTKKDYIKLAQALKDSRPDFSPNLRQVKIEVWRNTVEHLAQTLQFDNPQFNRDRFLHACGYTQEG